jgi:hypothetical protein
MAESPNPEYVLPTRKRRPSNAILDSKWDPEHIHAVKFWLESLLHTTLPPSDQLASGTPFEDGQLLFCVARTLAPDFRPNVRMVDSQLPFLAGNNVDFFLAFLKELNVAEVYVSPAR